MTRRFGGSELAGLALVLAVLAAMTVGAGIVARNRGPGPGRQQGATPGTLEAAGRDTEENQAACLANVKYIALAVGMYLADYGSLPPEETRPEVREYFDKSARGPVRCYHVNHANPYLRWPVILDPYIRNREVWSCPSARLGGGAGWIVPGPNWFEYEREHEEEWGVSRPGRERKDTIGGPCQMAWPPGWGGSVTDSIAQHKLAVPIGRGEDSTGAFRQDIGHSDASGLALADVPDPAWFAVCADANQEVISSSASVAYPDGCHIAWGGAAWCGADWEACPWTQDCGASDAELRQYRTDPDVLRKYTRHRGGSNIGFLDGHAEWLSASAIIADSPGSGDPNRGKLRGMGCSCLDRVPEDEPPWLKTDPDD